MTRGATAILTAATLLAHMLLGCCWHHAQCHAAAHDGVASGHADHDWHGHDHDLPRSEKPERNQSRPCDQVDCTFVRAEEIAYPESGLCVLASTGGPATDALDAFSAVWRPGVMGPIGPPGLSAPLYLRNQMLLL